MILDATCHISYTSNAPIPAVMMLRPRSGHAQWITREEYVFEPHAPVVEYTDKFGNLCQRVHYAHLGIALTRSLNIPARMVVGYLYQLEPMDLHAWFEAFVDGRWFTFDGVQKEARGNRIMIGYGRDAADVALTSNYGALELTTMKVTVDKAR